VNNRELDQVALKADRQNSLAPVTYIIKLHGPLAKALEAYARSEEVSAEMVIRESIRTYIGDAIR